MNDGNRGVILRSRPQGLPSVDNFEYVDFPLAAPKANQVLVSNQWLSLDPYMRGQISGRHLHGSVAPGELMLGECVGRVTRSNSEKFKEGDLVRGMLGWQAFSVADADSLSAVPTQIKKPSHALSILGMPGLTAYAGLMWQAEPKAGDTLVVASASGAVGSMIVQLAKREGCRVVAIAGSDEKCEFVCKQLGADVCINRKTEDLSSALKQHCPEGINIYFDLVGGEMLNIVSQQLAPFARVILCGLSANYNRTDDTPPAGPSPVAWILARARVHGLVVYDFEHRRTEFIETCAPLVEQEALTIKETEIDGLENAAQGFVDLMRGDMFGKAVVRI